MPISTDLPTHILDCAEQFELCLGTGPVPDDCDRIDARALDDEHALYADTQWFDGLTGFLAACQQGGKMRSPRSPQAGDVVIVTSDRGVGGEFNPYTRMEVAFVIQQDGTLRAIALNNYYDQVFDPGLDLDGEFDEDSSDYLPGEFIRAASDLTLHVPV